jgi:hypothetical protein
MKMNTRNGILMVAVAMATALLVTILGRAADQKADQEALVKSFKQYAGDFMKDWNVRHSLPVIFEYQMRPTAPKLWSKTYFTTVKDFDVDVKATDSLMNPYVGVIKFTQIWASSRSYSTKEEAEKSKDCGGEKSSNEPSKDCSEDPKANGTPEAFECTPKDAGHWDCKGGRLILTDSEGHEY